MIPAIRFYLGLYTGTGRTIALTTAAAAIQASLGLPITVLLQRLFDSGPTSQTVLAAVASAFALLALYLAGDALLVWATDRSLTVIKNGILRLRRMLMESAYRAPRVHVPESEIGRVHASMVHDAERVDEMTNGLIARVLPAVLSGTVLLGVLAMLSWRLFLVAVLVLPAAWGVTVLVRRPMSAVLARFHRVFEDFSTHSLAALQRVDLARLHAAESAELERHDVHLDALRDAGHRVALVVTVLAVVQTEVAIVTGIVVLLAGRWLIAAGLLTYGTLIAFYVVLAMVRSHVNSILTVLPNVIAGSAALVRLHAMLGREDAPTYCGTERIAFGGDIALEHVAFDYGSGPVLRDATLAIRRGETVALTGPNGTGKTTVARLILGLDRPRAGRLLADGHPFDDLDMAALRGGIGFALQDPMLFAASLRDNLTFGLAEPCDPDAIAAALAIAGADNFVATLDAGVDTWLGDGGARLSGGQRQRLSIARAILRRPTLLILDEPSNHLGAAEAAALVRRFRTAAPGAAILLISHAPDMLGIADRVYRLGDGVARADAMAPREARVSLP